LDSPERLRLYLLPTIAKAIWVDYHRIANDLPPVNINFSKQYARP
jgi:hypothetical protein